MRTTLVFVILIIGLFFFAKSFNETEESEEEVFTQVNLPSEDVANREQVNAGSDLTRKDSIIAFAEGLLGSDYREACKGPDAFDCSGFTYYVLQHFEVDVPGSSATQYEHGRSISDREIDRGDLVFFKSPSEGVDRVGHVGLVVSIDSGRIDFIHSSSYRGVVIDSLSQPHYAERYLGARRVIE